MMDKYKNDIYDLCSSTVERALRLFCDTINNSDADVFIIMAHKAVRLFQVLLEQNHIADSVANKIIIADQALDFDCTYLSGKKIAIIDDIIISGTSIASTVQKLLAIGVAQSNISIITLASDRRYMAMRFEGDDGKSVMHCATELEDSSCIELSATISANFAYYGLPYDVDFPDYPPCEISEEQFYFLFNDFLWDTIKLPSNELKDSNSEAYILFPRKKVLQLLWNRIGVNLEECAHLKLRIYVENFPSGRKRLQVVPLCLFNGISEDNLNVLYELRQPMGESLKLNSARIPLAKLRYVQFEIAHQLYLTFQELIGIPLSKTPFEHSTQLVFGAQDGVKVYNSLNEIHEYPEIQFIESVDCLDKDILKEFQESNIYQSALEDIQRVNCSEAEEEGYWINSVLLSPFLWWYDTKEIPVRQELSSIPRHYIDDYPDIDCMLMRLRTGFSLQTIHHLFKNVLSDYESEALISLFIDRSIDKGIIVPTIYHNKEERYLYRAYRHGEDLPFGLNDECRLLHFIKNLSTMIPNIEYLPERYPDGIAKISMEKLIVLFYQIGLKRGGIFNRFLGFNNIRLLKPFLSLHGVVDGFIDRREMQKHNIQEHFYSEQDENGYRYITWLTTWLTNNNFIRKNREEDEEKQVYYIQSSFIQDYLDNNERCCISAVIKEEIEYIAQMLSAWYNYMATNSQKDKFKQNIIALTSCSDAYVFSSAVATEIHYFSKFWKKQVTFAIDHSYSSEHLISLLEKTDDDKKQTFNTGQALNSGRDKVNWYDTDRAIKVIEDVTNILRNEGINGWIEIWESVKSAKFDTVPHDLKLYKDQIVGFFVLLLYML